MKTRFLTLNLRQKQIIIIAISSVVLLSILIGGRLISLENVRLNLENKNQSPSVNYLFGTDWLGRDMFLRTIKGLSLSIMIGVLVAMISTIIALVLSLLASWSRFFDSVITWTIDLFLSVPHIVVLILISFALGGGFRGLVVSLALTHWPNLTRVLRAEMLQIKSADFVGISRQLGKSNLWIARYHLLPHLLPQLFIGILLLFPHAILHEAAITFLGFGLSAEQPAIGIILSESMRYLSTGMWWLTLFPGLSLLFVVALFERLGKSIQLFLDSH